MSAQAELATVLVVDDAAANITVLDGILRGSYRVKVARNGAKALEIARSAEPPDLILLDIMMPQMDGYQVCAELKRDPRTAAIPVIFCTAMGEVQDESKGFALGAVDYITKPVSPPLVRARVETHIALYTQSRTLERQVRARTAQLEASRLDILFRLGRAAEFRDEDTGNHIIRVGLYARVLGEGLGLAPEVCDRLFVVTPLHDVGKIGVPDRILLKPDRLTEEEFALMRTHCEMGAAILREPSQGMKAFAQALTGLALAEDDNPLLEAAAVVALTHHEKWDGSGYPRGLVGEQIPIEGRIVALADVYDALNSDRPYKRRFERAKVLEILAHGCGTHFDPAVHAVFERSLEQFARIETEFAD